MLSGEKNILKQNFSDILALIPARGGSKGIPKKNIMITGGKPLIVYTINKALKSQYKLRVIVSTDNKEIANIAKSAGAEVPFIRPPKLANDDTPGILPVLHAIRWMDEKEDYQPDVVICLQPTSPLRNSDDIDKALELITQKDVDSVVSVTPVMDDANG